MADVRFSIKDYYFVYDARKGAINKQKHGIGFEAAAYVFLDNLRIDFEDERHSTIEEVRWITIGLVKDVLTVVYCERPQDGKNYYRLISARRATSVERRLYNDTVFGRT